MIRYIGLDFETSGSDIDKGAVPIQLGLAVKSEGQIKSLGHLIGGWSFALNGDATWSEEAAQVHKIKQVDLTNAEPVWKVDLRLAHWLLDGNHVQSRMWNVAVGWNVAGFDMRFIHRWFPNLTQMLSYRTVDLNALVFSLSNGAEGEYKRIKNLVKDYAAQQFDGTDWHDAEFDAKAALHSFEALQRLIKGEKQKALQRLTKGETNISQEAS